MIAPQKQCRGCGVLFVPRHHNQAYHDKDCQAPERRRACRSVEGRAREADWLKTYRARPDVKRKRALEGRERRLAWYGLTVAEFDALLAKQGGCAGCGFQGTPQRRIDVDHEHAANEKRRSVEHRRRRVRGLLCHRCNRALGLMHDSAESLRRLAAYVEAYEARRDA